MSRKPTVGVGALVIGPGNRILIGKRGPKCKRGAGLWALPGGRVDEGESFVDAMVREVLEETGLRVVPRGFVGNTPNFATGVPFALTDHLGEEDHLSVWLAAQLSFVDQVRAMISRKAVTPRVMEPDKCECWQWMPMQEVARIYGVNDKSDPQYYWLPLDMFRATLPKSLFGVF